MINRAINVLNRYKLLNWVPDKIYMTLLFRAKMGYRIDWKNPKTFNEKLNWMKLNDRKRLYSVLADKYEVKAFVESVIGKEYVVPNIGVWNSFDEIKFEELPNQFVVKCTHNSGGIVICKDKTQLNFQDLKKKYEKLLKENYYPLGREWPYKNITPRIVIDELLDDHTAGERKITLRDYKFWCFNGKPMYMYCTVKDKNIYENFYGTNFELVEINHGFERHQPEFEKPKNYEQMLDLAEKLAIASESPFIRVDFFNVDGHIYFSEYTFYDWGGLRPFSSYEQDLELGEFISLP